MRRHALLPLIPAVLLVVSACNPEHAGSAATIGSHRLDLGDFMDQTVQGFKSYTGPTDATTGAGAGKGTQAAFQRVVLTRSIRATLIDDVAATLGVKVTPTEIQQQIVQIEQQVGSHKALLQEAAAKGFSASALPQEIRTEILQSAVSEKLIKQNPVTEQAVQAYYAANTSQFSSFHVANLLVTDQALATTIATSTKADPTTFAAQARAHSLDTNTKAAGGDMGTQAAGALTQQGYPAEIETAILAAKGGEILGPFSIQGQTQTYYALFRVISVKNQSLAEARPSIESTLSAPTSTYVQGLFSKALTAAAHSARVHVSSRFGVWDATSATVVEAGTNPKTALSVTGRTDTLVPATGTVPATTTTP